MKNTFLRAHKIANLHRELTGRKGLSAKADGKVGSLYIYEMIGADWWTGGGITGKSVADALASMPGISALNIYINSEGGDVFEAKTIYEQLMRHSAEKTVYVDGLAASAATFVAMCGDRIVTAPAANWMIHEASGVAFGRADDMRAMADLLVMQNGDIAKLYAGRTGKPVDEMLQLMANETWMTAEQAKENGFTDEVAREEGDDAEDAAAALARSAPRLAAAVGSTQDRIREIKQARRAQEISARPMPIQMPVSRPTK